MSTAYGMFTKLSREIESFSGIKYHPENLSDFEWCFREIGRLGFSVSVTFLPYSFFEESWKTTGFNPPSDLMERAKAGLFSYQLKGGKYKDRGAHDCPLVSSAIECITLAIFNIHRLKSMGKLL